MNLNYIQLYNEYYTLRTKYFTVDIYVEEIIIILLVILFFSIILLFGIINYFIQKIKQKNNKLFTFYDSVKAPGNKKAFYMTQINHSNKDNKLLKKEKQSFNFSKITGKEGKDVSNNYNYYECDICNFEIKIKK